jgi:hypothetical protein
MACLLIQHSLTPNSPQYPIPGLRQMPYNYRIDHLCPLSGYGYRNMP